MKTLKQKTNEELLGAVVIGVHTAKEAIDRGIAKRCEWGQASHVIRRSGTYKDYYIEAEGYQPLGAQGIEDALEAAHYSY